MPALKHVLPQSCLDSLAPEAADLLDVDVVATKLTTGSPCSSHDELFEDWPGTEPHVRQWFVLANGKAVGVSEGPDAARTVAVAEYAP